MKPSVKASPARSAEEPPVEQRPILPPPIQTNLQGLAIDSIALYEHLRDEGPTRVNERFNDELLLDLYRHFRTIVEGQKISVPTSMVRLVSVTTWAGGAGTARCVEDLRRAMKRVEDHGFKVLNACAYLRLITIGGITLHASWVTAMQAVRRLLGELGNMGIEEALAFDGFVDEWELSGIFQ